MQTISDYRIQRDLSRDGFGSLVGCTGEFVRLMETGERRPGYKLALRIERATEGKITRSDLRPDIWPTEERAASET